VPLLADASSIAVVASPCIPIPRRSQRRATPFFSNLLGIGRSQRDRGVIARDRRDRRKPRRSGDRGVIAKIE
jgi:hypothetical protein